MKNILIIIFIAAIVVGAIAVLQGKISPPAITGDEKLKLFSSQQELEDFLKSSQTEPGFGYYGRQVALSGLSATGAVQESAKASDISSAPSDDFSSTNIQVAGVDEADIVKNDGKYIYVARNDRIIILDAFPAENAKILSELDIDGYVNEIFINDDKLIVFGIERERYYPGPVPLAEKVAASGAPASLIAPDIYPGPYYYKPPRSFIKIYDTSDKNNPKLERNLSTEGNYHDSRMIGNYVYAIFNQYPSWTEGPVPLPVIYENGIEKKLAATSIYHPIIPPVYSNQYTNIIVLNVKNENEEARMKSFLIDSSNVLFVSEDNIYITGQKQVDYRFQQLRIFDEAIVPSMPGDVQDKINSIKKSDKKDYVKYQEISNIVNEYMQALSQDQRDDLQEKINDKSQEIYEEYARESQKTVIHKIAIDRKNIEYAANGEVPGQLLNQFSMDEHEGNLRVATTTQPVYFGIRRLSGITRDTQIQDTQKNHLYVLDNDLDIIGKLEDLAPGERIYSARFIKDRAYLVTFKKVDPLFVIDISQPSQPKILGKLKIPGYSDYLHPYDEDTIIGLGKEAQESKQGDFALYQGMKIALFDVSDVANPRELAKYNLGDRGTDSEALHEHKAFLFSKEKNLLVLPVTLAEFKNPAQSEWEFGEFTFQGAYVFELTKDKGFELKGRISHIDEEEYLKSGSYPYFSNPVRRSLYIGNYLYTISDGFVKANKLDSLDDVKTIKLPKIDYGYPIYYGRGVASAVGV